MASLLLPPLEAIVLREGLRSNLASSSLTGISVTFGDVYDHQAFQKLLQ